MNKKMNESYLAGFFDGEGTILVGRQIKKEREYKRFTILLSQSGEDGLSLLEDIQKHYGGKIYKHLKAGQHKATKNAYKLYWNKKEGIELLHRIIPHLILKQEQAAKTLEYMERNNADKQIQDTICRRDIQEQICLIQR